MNMFPSIGTIDREIAVMATKVAIWKTIAPDSVSIDSTTLDGNAAKYATFDALWRGLVSKADEAMKNPGTPIPGQVNVTEFALEIIEVPGSPYYDNNNTNYNFIGPLYVEARLINAASGTTTLNPGKVFLSPSGLNTSGVRLVSDITSEPTLTGFLLPSDNLYGTNRNEQYITGGDVPVANTWESSEFYVAIPKSRTVPPRSDQILVTAMAKAPDVDVVNGTPVVFAFQRSGPSPRQDWNAIQAFIGGASGAGQVDLFAEARWNSGKTTLGELYVYKKVENGDNSNTNDTFTFSIYYNTADRGAPAPTLDRNKRLNFNDFTVVGVSNYTSNSFTLKNEGIAIISGLPMEVNVDGLGSQFYEYYYWIEETSKSGYGTPHFEIDLGKPDTMSVDGYLFGPFQLDDDKIDLAFVTVTNTRIPSEPYEPNEPEEPDEPDEPDVPDVPEEPGRPNRPGEPETPIDPNEPPTGGRDPPTGDARDTRIPIAMLLVGFGLVAIAEVYRRARKKDSKKS